MKYGDWTPNEIAALNRATAKLRAAQPKEQPKHKGIYWHNERRRFVVYLHTPDHKVYCGSAHTIEGALRMQVSKERQMAK